MTAIDTSITEVDLRLAPTSTTRHEFHRQIARLERELTLRLIALDAAHRPAAPVSDASPSAPRVLSNAKLEAARDALAARLGEVDDLLARQAADHAEARSLLKRMTEVPADFRWTTVTTKDLGAEGCRAWQSVPVLGPVGMLGNWWRVRVSSGCP